MNALMRSLKKKKIIKTPSFTNKEYIRKSRYMFSKLYNLFEEYSYIKVKDCNNECDECNNEESGGYCEGEYYKVPSYDFYELGKEFCESFEEYEFDMMNNIDIKNIVNLPIAKKKNSIKELIEKTKPKKNDIYTHYKGNKYRIKEIVRNSDDCTEELVIYESLQESDYPVGTAWSRPLKSFIDNHKDGMKRFTKDEI